MSQGETAWNVGRVGTSHYTPAPDPCREWCQRESPTRTLVFNDPLFRDEALARNAQPEPLDGLLRVTAPHEWLLLGGLAVALFAAFVWGALASVERTASARGVLLYPGERHAAVSTVSGIVSQVAARAGDRVDSDQVIARLELPELGWRLQVARARLALLEERATQAGIAARSWLDAETAAAHMEIVELEALEAAGAVVVSPQAGEITWSRLAEGQLVDAGEAVAEVRIGNHDAPEAIVFVPPESSRRIEVGMEATIAYTAAPGSRVFSGTVADASPRLAELPPWLSRHGLASSDGTDSAGHLIRLSLSGSDDARIPDGAACHVEIVLERRSPIGLLVSLVSRAG